MEIKNTTHDIKKAMNVWTLAAATVDNKTTESRWCGSTRRACTESGRDA